MSYGRLLKTVMNNVYFCRVGQRLKQLTHYKSAPRPILGFKRIELSRAHNIVI